MALKLVHHLVVHYQLFSVQLCTSQVQHLIAYILMTPSGLFEIGIINICNVLKKDETGIVWKSAFLV